jgi:hypothetical protein
MKCPAGSCVWRERYVGFCFAPIDERLRRNCPLPRGDACMTDQEALEFIKNRYPEQEEIWQDYLKRRELLKISIKEK